MATIVTRSVKGTPLTWDEMDTNLNNLNYGSFVSLKDSAYGAKGDGVTDDSAAFQATVNGGGKIIDGGGYTYKLLHKVVITDSNITIRNMIIDASGMIDTFTPGEGVIQFLGTRGTSTTLTANAIGKTDNVLLVTSTAGFVDEGYAFLSSNAIWDTSTNVLLGQYVKIKTVDSPTQLTLWDNVLYTFNTADTAVIAPLNPCENIVVENIQIKGRNDTTTQSGLALKYTKDAVVNNCSFTYFGYCGLIVWSSINTKVTKCDFRYGRWTGYSYGIAFTYGCHTAVVSNCYGENLRHLCTTGGTVGVNIYITYNGNHCTSMRDAGFDCHPGTDFAVITNNIVNGSKDGEFTGASGDGIVFQGANGVISNNTIIQIQRNGILVQHSSNLTKQSIIISGNSIASTNSTTSSGIYVTNFGAGDLNGVVIADNTMNESYKYGIYVRASTGNVYNTSITGNVVSTAALTDALFIQIASGTTWAFNNVAISGNTFNVAAGQSCVYIQGTGSTQVKNITFSNNVVLNGVYGLRVVLCDNLVESGNTYSGYSTAPWNVDTASTNLYYDRGSFPYVLYSTSTAYTVTPMVANLIISRLATVTLTLPNPVIWPNRTLMVKTIQAQSVISASSNVVPIAGGAAGTAILPATAGAWAQLISDGTNWNVAASS